MPLPEYIGPVGKSTGELIAEAVHGRDDDSPEITEAMAWLEDYASENGKTVQDAAMQAGAKRTVERAAQRLYVRAQSAGFHAQHTGA